MEQTPSNPTAPAGTVLAEVDVEWTVTRKTSRNAEVVRTYETQEAAVAAYLADPACALLGRVVTTFFLTPENAADYARFCAEEAAK